MRRDRRRLRMREGWMKREKKIKNEGRMGKEREEEIKNVKVKVENRYIQENIIEFCHVLNGLFEISLDFSRLFKMVVISFLCKLSH